MLKLIIADDENRIRRGLRSVLPWEELGVEVAGEAGDGLEVLKLCREVQPDLLLLDIRMPMMDGLEAAIKLREEGNAVRIIFISGVEDFSYVKTALDIETEGYILKPVKIDELQSKVDQVLQKIHRERNSRDMLHNLKLQLQQNLSVMRDKFLGNLISSVYMSERDVWEKISYFSLPFRKGELAQIGVLRIDDYEQAIDKFMEENKQLLSFSVANVTEEIMNTHQAGVSLQLSENEFLLIFSHPAYAESAYLEVCEEIRLNIKKYLKVSVSIGVGSPVQDLLTLQASYQEAGYALEHRFFTGNGSILHIKDIQLNAPGSDYPNLRPLENDIINALKLGHVHEVTAKLNEAFDYISNRPFKVEYVQSICVELISMAYRNLQELDEQIEDVMGNRAGIIDQIYGTMHILELREFMIGTFSKAASYFSERYMQKNSKLVERIRETIQQRYMTDVSIADLSKEVYLSANYIGLIFKRETGETITEFLTKTRLEAAKHLLKTTDMKILEVSETVGYENPQYFSTVFKKHTGIHPQMFRKATEVSQ
ncbi:hypothetical protein SY83_01570 [Paenibacillus swuensis]|uniref:AraC family transcriptional regulator n=1 Tax=Paenibacillus swuensis TaxID=1178515 RepID=A0A172TE54_9BACL|nr:response regulator [Paenibacillus swuensis]ANE45232.1 hypothetical protein SY83_01570 [Paenibacillus swuensis]